MKALLPEVLQNGLDIQDAILGPTAFFDPRRGSNDVQPDPLDADLTPDMRDHFHAVHGLTNSSWFFHSPLQYWSCSSQTIADEKDIIDTVNKASRFTTYVNVTLRHPTVFSGKRFEDQRLIGQ
jgi:hypothetical protein